MLILKPKNPAVYVIEMSRWIKKRSMYLSVLKALYELDDQEYRTFANFRYLMQETGMKRSEVRAYVRALARRSMAVYGNGLWNFQNDRPAGAGYAITSIGIGVMKLILSEESKDEKTKVRPHRKLPKREVRSRR